MSGPEKLLLKGRHAIIVIIALFLLAGLFDIVSGYAGIRVSGEFLKSIGIIGWLGAIGLLLLQGSFRKTRWFKIAHAFVAILIIGLMFLIMHWQYGNLLVTIGSVGVFALYGIHFLRKPHKNNLDYLKMLWLTLYFVGFVFRFLHWSLHYELGQLEYFLLIILFTVFVSKSSSQALQTGSTSR